MNELRTPLYSLCDVAVVIRRHTHDVRNALNGMELELALLDGAMGEGESHEAVGRLRHAISEIGRVMQRISSKYSTEIASPVPALQIAERWRMDARHVAPDVALEWNIQLLVETVCVEIGLMRTLLSDLLETAVRIGGRGGLHLTCRSDAGQLYFEVAFQASAVIAGVIEADQAYWASLRRLAERNQGLMEPEKLSAGGSPLRLVLPLCPAGPAPM